MMLYGLIGVYLAVGFIIGGVYIETLDEGELEGNAYPVLLLLAACLWPVFLCVTAGVYAARWFKKARKPKP